MLDTLDKVQELTKTGIWEFSFRSKRIKWSREMYRIHGVPDDFPLQIEAILELYAPSDRHRLEEALQEMPQSKQPSYLELQLTTPAGQSRLVRSVAFPQEADGKVARLVGYVSDITESKAAAEAARALQGREREIQRLNELSRLRMELFRSTAHELNTPLTPLRVTLATLRLAPNLDQRQLQSLQLMDRNVKRLEDMVRDMLDASRLQDGRLRFNPGPCNLMALIGEVVETFREAAARARLELAAVCPPEVMVQVDRSKTLQILVNLVSNAVKYTPQGRVEITAAGQKTHAVVTVMDTGLGLTPVQLSQLFQPFVRLHDTIGIAGTGLGLYIAKGLAELQGGRIWAESKGAGQGTAFHISLPLAGAGNPA